MALWPQRLHLYCIGERSGAQAPLVPNPCQVAVYCHTTLNSRALVQPLQLRRGYQGTGPPSTGRTTSGPTRNARQLRLRSDRWLYHPHHEAGKMRLEPNRIRPRPPRSVSAVASARPSNSAIAQRPKTGPCRPFFRVARACLRCGEVSRGRRRPLFRRKCAAASRKPGARPSRPRLESRTRPAAQSARSARR